MVPSTDRIGRTGESRILLVSRQCRELDIDFNGIYALVLSQFDPDIEVRSVKASTRSRASRQRSRRGYVDHGAARRADLCCACQSNSIPASKIGLSRWFKKQCVCWSRAQQKGRARSQGVRM